MQNAKNKVRTVLVGTGIAFIVLGVVILSLGLWEAFVGIRGKVNVVHVPGFQELTLDAAGLYAGVYQHRGAGQIPAQSLAKLDVRILSKSDYREVQVLMNTTGQTFTRFGQHGMLLFNFMIDEPGEYTMSAIYPEGREGPVVPVYLFAQAAQNIKQTLVVAVVFFAVFLTLGIVILVKKDTWAPV